MENDYPEERSAPSVGSEERDQIPTVYLLLVSLLSGLAYVTIAWVLFRFVHDAPLGTAFASEVSRPAQFAAGVGFGVSAAAVIMLVFSYDPLRSVLRDFAVFQFIAEARFSTFDRGQISVVAGVGEEVLFRGAVQPLIGIWWTSLLFVALHGYFGFRSPAHYLFGLAMFLLSVGLGLLFEHVGLAAAIIAHAVYDFVMLEAAQRWRVFDRDG